MATLEPIIVHADEYLKTAEIVDYGGAHNGLQLTNGNGEILKIGAAVDACLPVIEQAVAAGCDLLVVHHGLFWSGVQMIDGAVYEKLKLAMEHGLAIYSSHLPLDAHEEIGNSMLLAKAMGIPEPQRFFEFKGTPIGVRGEVHQSRADLIAAVEKAVGGNVHCAAGGPDAVSRVAVISGGAGSEIARVAALGCDTLITGEGPHHTYTLAEELGANLIYAGHYATETFGVKALVERLAAKFGADTVFLDHPTGL